MLDPFVGSGTTARVAKKLGRKFVGFELSDQYAAAVQERLETISVGDDLDGAPEPSVSAPSTANGKRVEDRKPGAKRMKKEKKQAEVKTLF